MKIDYSALQKALGQLEMSLDYVKSDQSRKDPELRRVFRAAAIKAFEFTYELSTSLIRRQLAEIVLNPAELREMPFLDLMRSAADAGLIREAPPFRLYREKRNITSHTYNEDKAEDVLSVMDAFVGDVRFFLAELKRRNP
jgi:nucleotidyltransferase substrate binding protein (TIGR01987 family)